MNNDNIDSHSFLTVLFTKTLQFLFLKQQNISITTQYIKYILGLKINYTFIVVAYKYLVTYSYY